MQPSKGTQPSRAKYCFQEINQPFAMNQPTNQGWSYVFLSWSNAPITFSKSYINILFASMLVELTTIAWLWQKKKKTLSFLNVTWWIVYESLTYCFPLLSTVEMLCPSTRWLNHCWFFLKCLITEQNAQMWFDLCYDCCLHWCLQLHHVMVACGLRVYVVHGT